MTINVKKLITELEKIQDELLRFEVHEEKVMAYDFVGLCAYKMENIVKLIDSKKVFYIKEYINGLKMTDTNDNKSSKDEIDYLLNDTDNKSSILPDAS